nr:MAG: putative RNA-dependent RNA polymerase [Mitoviridae sp.]
MTILQTIQTLTTLSNLDLSNRNYTTKVDQEHSIGKGMSLRQSNPLIPSINHARNNKRFANAVNALISYINIQSGLPDWAVSALVSLISRMEALYHDDPKAFVGNCKKFGNWFKVNCFRRERLQDSIHSRNWNANAKVPKLLLEIFSVLVQLKTDKEKMMFVRLVLSIFELCYVVTTPTLPKHNTITDPGKDVSQVFTKDEILTAFEWLGIKPTPLTEEFKFSNQGRTFHLSSASGPNGQAVWNSHLDAQAILKDQEVLGNFEKMAILLGRDDLMTVLREAAKLPQLFGAERSSLLHSKLHVIFEKGDKARTIAILDYFTQEIMSPFHDLIAGILKGLDQDGTFDQTAIAEKVRTWTSNPSLALFSFDLSAATDRLPVTLQRFIINNLIEIDGFGQAWQRLLTFRTFDAGCFGEMRYSVGQPMGAKSSFPMLGLTHHIIVQIAAKRAGFIQKFLEYVILGDDIMIANAKVASIYKELMAELGLEISEVKSIESTPSTHFNPIAEICRRCFVSGFEVTPLPMKLIATVTEQNILFLQLQEKMQERGLINIKDQWREFAIAIVNSQKDWQTICLHNSLPTWLTGFKEQFNFGATGMWNFADWAKAGITEEVLYEFYKFTVISEQFKRISTLIQAADDGFKAISKSIQLADIVFVNNGEGKEVPKSMFTRELMQEWNILNVAHPARFVMLGEVNRISGIMAQISSIRGQALITQLLAQIVDKLKYSILEIIKDEDLSRAIMERTLIEKVRNNIFAANNSENKILSFTVKIDPLKVMWLLKVQLFGSCTLSRSISNISTTRKDAQLKLKRFNTNQNEFFSLFDKEK